MARVVVVGAGLAGLCGALALADFGHEVTVVEAGPRPGGQLAGHRIGGHHTAADLGPAVFTLPAVLRDLFRKTGRPLEKELDVAPVEPAVRLVFASGERVDVPNATRAGAIRAFDDVLGAGAGGQWDAVVRHGERTWQRLRPAILGHAEPPAITRSSSAKDPSLRNAGRQLLADHRLRSLLDTYATTVGADPATAPATLTVLPYLEQTFGMWTVDGGVHRLADVLHRRAVDRRARFRFGTRAAGVVADSGRVAGVRLAEGETVGADVVMWTAAPGLLPDDVTAGRRPRWRRSSPGDDSGAAASVVTVAFAARSAPTGRPLRTVVVPTGTGTPVVTVLAQPGGWVLHAPAPPHQPDGTDWTTPGRAEDYASTILAAASTGADLPRDPAAISTIRTPHDLERGLGVPGGRVYGSAAQRGVAALLRRPGTATRLRGLFLAGAGAHPGPGVPLVAVSAAIVTDLVGRA
ncbi:phytoene desaturase family protein [Jiangella gansuensis]|uniref:phytoene desaturase family protein n=1 Tax=Jiangella gansuensis TaxID=281473 RepID=UPI00047BFE55|nr:NAD(P)/FAD-dependent oxidoreductase [Jiangella gansuensis]